MLLFLYYNFLDGVNLFIYKLLVFRGRHGDKQG